MVAGILVLGLHAGAETAPTPDGAPSSSPQSVQLDEATLAAAAELGLVLPAIESGDLDAAEVHLAAASSVSALTDFIDLFRGRLLLERKQPRRAIELAHRGESEHKGSPIRWAYARLLGDALEAEGEEEGARAAWELARQHTSNVEQRAALLLQIARSFEREGLREAAADGLREVDWSYPATEAGKEATARLEVLATGLDQPLRSAPEAFKRAERLYQKGWSELALAGYEEALAGTLSAVERKEARMKKGRSQFRLRRYPEAVESFAKLAPDPEARYWEARSHARAGEVTRSIKEFKQLARTAPPSLANKSLYMAALLLDGRGEIERAVALYGKVAANRRYPEQSNAALWRWSWALFLNQEYEQARKGFSLLSRREEDPIDRLRPRYWAARTAQIRGDEERGRAELLQIAAEYPFSYYGWRAVTHLGHPKIQTPKRTSLGQGRAHIGSKEIERAELLLAASLNSWAKDELDRIFGSARSLRDRVALGALFTRAGDYHAAERLMVDAYAEVLAQGVRPGQEQLWELAWPRPYDEIFGELFSETLSISPELVLSIMREESGFRPEVVSSAGAYGLLQIMPDTGARLARKVGHDPFSPEDLFFPQVNIKLGATYLDELKKRFPDRPSAAVGSYNAGPEAVAGWLRGEAMLDDDIWVEKIPYSQTRSYVKRVLRSLNVYHTFYGRSE